MASARGGGGCVARARGEGALPSFRGGMCACVPCVSRVLLVQDGACTGAAGGMGGRDGQEGGMSRRNARLAALLPEKESRGLT